MKVTNETGHSKIATLTYNAATGLLTGLVGNQVFNDLADSGGARGHKSTTHAVARRYLHSNSLNESMGRLATTREAYDKKTDRYTQRGGTLPPGHYHCVYLENHGSFHRCIRLDQMRDAYAIVSPYARQAIFHHRGGFFIHGHGPKGSDGCLVPVSEARRRVLNDAVRDFNGRVILHVTHVSYLLPAELEPTGGQSIS
jgi:hypothetical protein